MPPKTIVACGVCSGTDTNFKSKCRHHFHKDCFMIWLRKNINCPTCNAPQPNIFTAIQKNQPKIFQECLNLGQASRSIDGQQPGRICVKFGRIEMLTKLIEVAGEENYKGFNFDWMIRDAFETKDMEMITFALNHPLGESRRNTAIIYAIKTFPIDVIEYLVRNKGLLIDVTNDLVISLAGYDIKNVTPLIYAINANKDLDYLKRLVALGAKVSKGGFTEMLMSVRYGKLDILKYIAEIHPGPLEFHVKGHTQRELLCWTIEQSDFSAGRLLIELGADIHLVSRDKSTTLGTAIKHRMVLMVDLLIKKGAKLYDPNTYPELLSSCDITDFYLMDCYKSHGFDFLRAYDSKHSFFSKCIEIGSAVYVKSIHRDMKEGRIAKIPDYQLMRYAVETHNTWSLDHFLYEIDVNILDNDGMTSLMHAASLNRIEALKMLVEKGADVDLVDNSGRTALHHAVLHNHATITTYLLEQGAKLSKKDKSGSTPLHITVKNRNRGMVELLLSKGAVTNLKDGDGANAMERAVLEDRFDIAQLILEKQIAKKRKVA